MSSRMVDLTGDSSDVESESEPEPEPQPSTATSGPHATRVAAHNGNHAIATPDQNVSAALKKSISTIDPTRLRRFILRFCETIPELREGLEKELLVKGKTIVRYHLNSDSEDRGETEEESTDEEANDHGVSKYIRQTEKEDLRRQGPIVIEDEEFTPKFAKCENCKKEFDVSDNDTRDCHWHTGMREVYDDDDFWADHDPNCHGNPEDFDEDPDFADGFRWSCCGTPGDNEGCKTTRHKASVNIVLFTGSKKRKATEELR
ncbi:hypothetical protein VTL71DRAFT_11248 [Oculimacula yallundae]|uniref:C2H2-type domain-containing protein n=1 Tax=Oculimacula yallundae TaxID=86028 RepID=A0ABR4CWF7_9HELO